MLWNWLCHWLQTALVSNLARSSSPVTCTIAINIPDVLVMLIDMVSIYSLQLLEAHTKCWVFATKKGRDGLRMVPLGLLDVVTEHDVGRHRARIYHLQKTFYLRYKSPGVVKTYCLEI
jgi:hypothetical protein